MPTEKEKHKVVQVARKYLKQLDDCPFDKIGVAEANIDVLWQVGKRLGCTELIHAVFAKDLLESEIGRGIIFSYIENPLQYMEHAKKRIEQFKDYLK